MPSIFLILNVKNKTMSHLNYHQFQVTKMPNGYKRAMEQKILSFLNLNQAAPRASFGKI